MIGRNDGITATNKELTVSVQMGCTMMKEQLGSWIARLLEEILSPAIFEAFKSRIWCTFDLRYFDDAFCEDEDLKQ